MLKHKVTICLILIFKLTQPSSFASEVTSSVMMVKYNNSEKSVTYHYYVPNSKDRSFLPVIVGIPGLNQDGLRFLNNSWLGFADKYGFAIVALHLTFNRANWEKGESYQYPSAWSGNALLKILKHISEEEPINTNELYLFGISAGAQFAHRFALLHPDKCQAVAVHAAGGYTFPTKFIPTKFLLTVGEFDNETIKRVNFAKSFHEACLKNNIDSSLQIIPNKGHAWFDEQEQVSRDLFIGVSGGRKH